ncbi:MAG TPA: kelch repeat-containing protein [Candidatus Krumholzibacteria bacterium]|nr:kelch repeat-containing protein [Candidatus Krumholzibacteria bacterium]
MIVLLSILVVLTASPLARAATQAHATTATAHTQLWIETLERARAERAMRNAPTHAGATATTGDPKQDGVWSHLSISSLEGHVSVYDPSRDRMLVFGGDDNSRFCADVWSLSMHDAHAWTHLTPAGDAPTARSYASGIYDPVRDRLLIFGGWTFGTNFDDLWSLSLSGTPRWTHLSPAGTGPSSVGRMIYDPVRDRAIVYDGPERVWALSLSDPPAWTQLTIDGTGPADAAWPVVIYDSLRDRMVIWGGVNDDWPLPTDTWAIALSGDPRWEQVETHAIPPQGRFGATAIYDPVRDRMILYAGSNYHNLSDLWWLSFANANSWQQLSPVVTPMRRSFHTAIYDSKRKRMVVFAGAQFSHGPPDSPDVWGLALDGALEWSALNGTSPSPRYGHAAVYDPRRDRMLMYGGRSDPWVDSDELWACSLDSRPTWTELHPAGPAPPGGDVDAVYDPAGDRLIVLADGAWSLPLQGALQWKQLDPGGSAPAYTSAAVYDSHQHRVVVLGPDNAVWTLSLSPVEAWKPLDAIASQPVPGGSDAIYDPRRDRLLLFGEKSNQEVWSLPLSGTPEWERLVPSGPSPSPRYNARLMYDPVRDRMILFRGLDATDNVFALSLSGTLEWQPLSPGGGWGPFGEDLHSVMYDPVRDRMVVFGGRYFYNSLNDAWVLTWGDPATTGAGAPAINALKPCYPNPFNPRVTIPFELQKDGDATLVVYDVSGRVVKTLLREWTTGGAHTVVWDGRSAAGDVAASGVYFCRLSSGSFTSTQKIVLLK